MNDRDQELFETELSRLRPARPPEDFMARLAATPQKLRAQAAQEAEAKAKTPLGRWFPWVAPLAAAAALVAALAVWHRFTPAPQLQPRPSVLSAKTSIKPDTLEIDRQLVASYGAVLQLPTGEPVRLLFREWRDDAILRDPSKRIVIEAQTPRLEVVSVSFDTY
jgi:hypothetical protein